MGKRYDELVSSTLVESIEKSVGKPIDAKSKSIILQGAGEEDLVNSGLEETMIHAYNEIRDAWKKNKKIPDLRTAAFVVSINKIADSYIALGIFP